MSIFSLFKKFKRLIIILVSSIIFLLLFIAFILPLIIKPIAEKNITDALKRKVTIGHIGINPLTLSCSIDDFSVTSDSTTTFLSFKRFYVNVEAISLLKRGLICKAVTLDSLFVNVVRMNDSTYNFSDLLTPSKKTDTASSPFRFSFNNINISNGRILFNDKPENTIHEVKQISLGVPFISNFNYYTKDFSTPSFSAIVNETPVSLNGKTRPFDESMETSFDCNIKKIDIAKYVQYIPNDLKVKLKSAYLSTDGHFTFMVKNKEPFFDYSGNVSLDSIAILSQSDSLIFRLPALSIDIASAELVSSRINLKAITINEPYLNVIRNRDGTISLLDLLPPSPKTPDKQTAIPSPSESSGFSLAIDTIYLHKGDIRFLDLAPGKPVMHHIMPLTTTISSFELNKGCDFSLFLANNTTQTAALNGNFQFSPLGIKGNCKLDSIEPGFYVPYFPPSIDIAIKKGTFSLASDFNYVLKDSSLSVTTDNGYFRLSNLLLHRKSNGEKLITARELKLLNAAFDLKENMLTMDSVISDNVKVFVKRQSDSTINLASLVLPDSTDSQPEEAVEQTSDSSASIFRYTINTVKLKNYFVQFNDFTTPDNDSLQLEKINLTLSGLSNNPQQKASLGFNAALNPQGKIAVSGTIQMTPLQSALQLDISTISLKPAQAYLANQLNIVLTDGLLNLHGKFNYAQGDDSIPKISYNGNLQIDDFVTINKENADNLLLWKSLAFQNISYLSTPATISIDTIKVDALYSLFNIYADGTTNLQKIIKTDTTVKTEAVSQVDTTSKSAADPVITINTVALDNCNVNFSDFSFRNVFSANMKNLTGTVNGLSSLQDKIADVMINGNYDATSPITIRGAVNPLAKNLFMDLGLNFKNIDITQMNPYAQKYLGYVIRKGKLTLDLRYFIENNKLNSSNKIFLDQLTLGESVESPSATKLPVKFALALLRDQNGDINLDVPVTGSIDDPKFNVGKILLQVLGNIITKAVTSPFAALGALFGNTEELSFLEYNPGSTITNAQAQDKIDKITKILQQKEELVVEIQGFADPVIDHDALKKQSFDRKLKTIKLKDLLRASNKNILVDTITINTDEYENYLSKAYSKEPFEKPKTRLGFTKALPVPEMEKLINDNIRITETDLKALAASRALSIKELLVNTSHIDASRVFLIESTSITSTKKDVTTNSRVEFTLKAK
jgi:hypothetical protein